MSCIITAALQRLERSISVMKRPHRFTAGLLCAVLAAALALPAYAHGCRGARGGGHHSGYRSTQTVQTTVTVCPYDDCTSAGRHSHSGTLYCGYGHASGVCDGACRALCPVEGCETLGRHIHGLTAYCGYDHDAGFCDGACRALCPYEDCTEAGRHTHDGVFYCGYDHGSGYCDGACQALCPLEGCTIDGRHIHGLSTYCGAHHESGFCDGSCAAVQDGHHHGGCWS